MTFQCDSTTSPVRFSMPTDTDAATVLLFGQLYIDCRCLAAASVLFIYDTVITFDREVAYFWTAKRTGASILFFANKWISMMVYVMAWLNIVPLLGPSDKAMTVLQFVPGAAFSALRAFVLVRSRLLGLLVLVLSLAPVGVNLVLYSFQLSGVNLPSFGCLQIDNTPAALTLRFVVLISRIPLIIADILLIYVTWSTLCNGDALKNIRQSKRLTLSDILFRGGTIYFVILSILNILQLVLTLTSAAIDGNEGSVVTAFTAPITAILISRFLLELQEANQVVVRLDPGDPLHSSRHPYDSTPTFISSLAGFVNPALSEAQSEDHDDDGCELQIRSRSEHGEEEREVLAESCQAAASSSA
ncbi:hypothetical protein OH76DRAFT_724843 [Lentinus brumalis]|uniref:DUF6533 domain-containing protein n=1 Tax=Lentinus brumalis TaxID=2498619 RepID=A0A371D567_9APHY|nr:hypothetical protein OH76DRAFT_724843 [Polyporus brumalis]